MYFSTTLTETEIIRKATHKKQFKYRYFPLIEQNKSIRGGGGGGGTPTLFFRSAIYVGGGGGK